MIRFASLDSLLRIIITGLILIAVFGLGRSSPSALRSYEGVPLKSAPALTDAPTLGGVATLEAVPTPSVARFLVAPGARLIAGPGSSTFRWSGPVDGTPELSRQAAQPATPASGGAGPVVRGPALEGENNGHKAHGGSAE
jgi:hypothetical protein